MSGASSTKVTAGRVFLLIALTGTLSGCSDPCEDYCEVFVTRAQECGLGGPSGDQVIEDCGDEVSEVLTDDTCDTAAAQVSTMSCMEFTSLVCAEPNAELTYQCN
jgi:hypothetical protein